MTNTPRGEGPEPTQPLGPSYPPYSDPAYAGQSPYGPTYQAPQVPDPTRQLPPYSPYGYDPYATGQYGPPYPPGEPPGDPLAQVAALAVGGGRGGGTARCRPGDRLGGRQQLETGHGRRAAADAGTDHARRPPGRRRQRRLRPLPPIVPVPTTHPAQRVGDPGCNRDRGLRGQRRRQGDQHHLRRHRQPAADRVQCRAAVAQGSGIAQSGRGFGEPDDHQCGSRGHLLGDDQRCPGAVEHRQRPDDLHRGCASAPVSGAVRAPPPWPPGRWRAPPTSHRCRPERCRTSR